MKTTMTLATNLNVNPFKIFDQEIDEVIMLINFYIKLQGNKTTIPTESKEEKGKIKRVRVNDKTATGGWF